MPSRPADKIRRLMHYGQVMQSHALHFFHLSSPDLLFGFDSEVNRRNIVGVAAAHPDIAKKGVLLRKFGQEVIRATAGKRVHGTGSVPGGMNKHVSRTTVRCCSATWRRCSPGRRTRWRIAKQPARAEPGAVRPLRQLPLEHAVAGARRRRAGAVRRRDPRARRRGQHRDGASDQGYLDLIEEEVKPWTYMKFPYLRGLGPDAGLVPRGAAGAGAELRLHPHARWPRRERREFVDHGRGEPVHATLAYHWARMIEVLHAWR
jgi:NAD-reducing hydrogenase large subunit